MDVRVDNVTTALEQIQPLQTSHLSLSCTGQPPPLVPPSCRHPYVSPPADEPPHSSSGVLRKKETGARYLSHMLTAHAHAHQHRHTHKDKHKKIHLEFVKEKKKTKNSENLMSILSKGSRVLTASSQSSCNEKRIHENQINSF